MIVFSYLSFPPPEILAVEPGTRAVIFDKVRGIQDTVVSEGTHFRIPILQVRKSFSNY